MEDQLHLFKRIIRECNYDNTYKMALAKALVELSLSNSYENETVIISTEEIASLFLKYYWNQTIFFDLIQGSNLKKKPIILQKTKQLIDDYYTVLGTKRPERFEKVEFFIESILRKEYTDTISFISGALCKDVAWRFTYIDQRYADELLVFDKKKKQFITTKSFMRILNDNSEDLFDLINYRWGMILETFNSSPRINKKVKIIDQEDIKRNSLNKFKNLLDTENPNRKCFICGKEINDDQLSIDHVIPWSYLYSDDLWNLVYVHKSCNSSKSNVIPDKVEIDRLKERNNHLYELLKTNNVKGKSVDELEIAIDKDYVDKFWVGCQ